MPDCQRTRRHEGLSINASRIPPSKSAGWSLSLWHPSTAVLERFCLALKIPFGALLFERPRIRLGLSIPGSRTSVRQSGHSCRSAPRD